MRKGGILLSVHADSQEWASKGMAAGLASAKIVKHATLKVYAGAPHGLADTHQTQFGGDLLEFVTLR